MSTKSGDRRTPTSVLFGVVGNKPEVTTHELVTALVRFRLARITVGFDRDTGERKLHPQWTEITLGGELAEVAAGIERYSQVRVKGLWIHTFDRFEIEPEWFWQFVVTDLKPLGMARGRWPALDRFVDRLRAADATR